jgi:phosphoglycerate dehydrogenase-like enzyme
MKVVLYLRIKEIRWTVSDEDLAVLERRFPDVRFVRVTDDDDLPAALADADVFVGFHFPPELFATAARLRWIHSVAAGVEENLFPAMVESDVVLTNAAGMHAVNIPEHAIALVCALARNLHVALRLQADRCWDRYTTIAGGGGFLPLAGSHMAVLGAGAIGQGVVHLARGLGMRVRVMRRRPGLPVEGAEAVVGPETLHPLLAWADFVVIAAPLTPDTHHLIDHAALAAMRSSARLVNVGRGEIIDDEALVEALRAGAIAGAGLDVFTVEPLPADHPYWGLDSLIITPHVSGYLPDFFARALALFADNLERFRGRRPLRNLVDKRLGYAPDWSADPEGSA